MYMSDTNIRVGFIYIPSRDCNRNCTRLVVDVATPRRLSMDLQSDSEDEVEVEQQDQDEEQTSAAHPTNEETTRSARECGTPGCDLADGHLELCKTQQVTGPRRPSMSMQTGKAKEAEKAEEVEEVEKVEEVEEVEAETEQGPAPPANHKAKVPPLTAAEARAQATSEGLTLESSANQAGYLGVSHAIDHRRASSKRNFQARVWRTGKHVHLGCFATAEEAALTVARAKFHTASQLPRARANSDTVASRQKATKRAAPPPKPPRTKQARQATATGPSQAVPLPTGVAPAAVPAAPAAPPAETLQQKVGRIKAVLQLDPTLPLVDAIKAANELMEIAPAKAGLPSQVDTLLATIG